MSYPIVSIDDVCIVGDGAHAKIPRLESGVPYLTSKNIRKGYLDLSNVDYISKSDYQKYFSQSKSSVRNIQEGDVLVGIIGTFGNCYRYKKEDHFGISSSIAILRPNPIHVTPDYLYYYVSSQIFYNYLEAAKGGSVQGYTNLNVIRGAKLPLPDLKVQASVVEILSSLDEKIELNQKINQTLEEMAMKLYKHWFIDFGPFQDGVFEESELGMIPKGWKASTVGESIEILGGGTPSTKVTEYWNDGKINWYSPTDLTSTNKLFLTSSTRKITEEGLKKSAAKLFPPYSVMMTSRATIGAIAFNRLPAATNQGFITLLPNENYSKEFLYCWLKQNKELIHSLANGTTFLEVSRKNFKTLPILCTEKTKGFSRETSSIFDQIESLIIENEYLISTRDYLLPRLLSGEIEVKDVEKQVEEVL